MKKYKMDEIGISNYFLIKLSGKLNCCLESYLCNMYKKKIGSNIIGMREIKMIDSFPSKIKEYIKM